MKQPDVLEYLEDAYSFLMDPAIGKAIDEIKRLREALRYEENRFNRIGTHSNGCYEWGPRHYECAMREIERLRLAKDSAYLERNKLVAMLANVFPSGIKKTAIQGWDECWHGCVYIDFPWGQASWHYHDDHAYLFEGLRQYHGEWDGHTTDTKYDAIIKAIRKMNNVQDN